MHIKDKMTTIQAINYLKNEISEMARKPSLSKQRVLNLESNDFIEWHQDITLIR